MSRQKKLINKTNYPQHAIEKFARCVYPDIVTFYQSEEGQREFAEWQAEQAAKKAQRKLHTTKKEVTAAVTSVVILWAFFPWASWLGSGKNAVAVGKVDLLVSLEINK